ncbi:hypothetical protein ACVWY2_001277 [Bradyrhizobium sp. JR6.1]
MPFGAVDHLTLLQRMLGAVEFILQLGKGIEAGHAEIEDRLHPLLLEAVDDVGGDARLHRGLDRGGVALVDEHRDRAADRTADLEHLFQHVAAGILEVDDDDLGIERIDPRQQALHLADMDHVRIAGLPQSLLEDGRTDRALVDDDDLGRRFSAHRPLLKPGKNHPYHAGTVRKGL